VNALHQAKTAYGGSATPVRTHRGTEYALFTRVTRKLHAAARLGHGGFATLASALHDNRNMWTTLAADVADDGNQLPEALRAQVFYLAEFTALHTRKVLKGEASVRPLLEINMSVMRGLAGHGSKP
jgi:flagellar protein FlaF